MSPNGELSAHPSPRPSFDAVLADFQAALGDALSRTSGPVELVVRVEPDRVSLRVLSAAEPAGLGMHERSFAAWLRVQLDGRAISQEAFARRLGVSTKTINRWIHGTTEPRFRELVLLYDALGTTPFEVVGDVSSRAS